MANTKATKKFNLKEAKNKMSTQTRLRTDFKVSVDHIRDRVVSNLSEARRQGMYKIDDNSMRKILSVIDASFEQGFVTSSAQIEKSINETLG